MLVAPRDGGRTEGGLLPGVGESHVPCVCSQRRTDAVSTAVQPKQLKPQAMNPASHPLAQVAHRLSGPLSKPSCPAHLLVPAGMKRPSPTLRLLYACWRQAATHCKSRLSATRVSTGVRKFSRVVLRNWGAVHQAQQRRHVALEGGGVVACAGLQARGGRAS